MYLSSVQCDQCERKETELPIHLEFDLLDKRYELDFCDERCLSAWLCRWHEANKESGRVGMGRAGYARVTTDLLAAPKVLRLLMEAGERKERVDEDLKQAIAADIPKMLSWEEESE